MFLGRVGLESMIQNVSETDMLEFALESDLGFRVRGTEASPASSRERRCFSYRSDSSGVLQPVDIFDMAVRIIISWSLSRRPALQM